MDNLLNINFSSKKKQLSSKKKEKFYSELSILLGAGMDLKSALMIISEESENNAEKLFYQELHDKIVQGENLSKTMELSHKFAPYEYYTVLIGEESGQLNNIIKYLSEYYVKKNKQQRQIISAITYPILILITAVITLIFMFQFVVPMFIDVFKRFNTDLPGITQKIIGTSYFFKENALVILIVFGMILLILNVLKTKTWYKRIISNTILYIPYFGKLIRSIYLARFCQAMQLLATTRTPLLKSLQLIKKMIVFQPMIDALDKIEQDIFNGISLHKSMGKFKIYDKRMVTLTKVAEEVNQIDQVYNKLYELYQQESEHKISMMNSVLEPLLIVIVGGIVGVIIVAMYLPLFKLSTTFF